MEKIVRPLREIYNRKGYVIVVFFALTPWIALIVAWSRDSVIPPEEFIKFFTAATVMAAGVCIHISWGNWKVYRYRRFRENFMKSAKKAKGYILQSEEVFLDSRLQEVTLRGIDRPYWKLKVRYYNDDLAQIDTFYSDYFSDDPMKILKTDEIDVFYEKAHVVMGDVKI